MKILILQEILHVIFFLVIFIYYQKNILFCRISFVKIRIFLSPTSGWTQKSRASSPARRARFWKDALDFSGNRYLIFKCLN
jgi:hypothetical protein